jgi:16S rRNA (guanine527-N7)-methyltransferase
MTPAEFGRAFGVSRETLRRLEIYVELIRQWNKKINLVSPATIDAVWQRHIADSAQLLELAPPRARSWIDLGSGAGLPGIPVAIIAAERQLQLQVTLAESGLRKAAFLHVAVRELGLRATVEARRIESLPPRPFDVVSARALAPLDRLCALAPRFGGPGTVFLFPKGARLDSELTAAARHWHIRAERIPSRTDRQATILKIAELEPRS